MSFTIPTIFTAVDKLTAPIRKMTSSVQGFAGKAEAGVARLDRRLRKMTPSIGAMGKQVFAFASAAAVGTLLMSSVTTLKDYETNMASLQAITGVTTTEMLTFKTGINEVAKATKSSAVEVSKAFELVGSAKPELLKDAEGLAEVTKQAIILSQASGDDLETSVQSLTGTLNQFNLGADQASTVINNLAAGSQAGAAAVPQITESLDKFGTVAASMNVNVAESVGLIETLAEKNIKGAEAGTKLRNVLTKMAIVKALPDKALKQLAKFGVNTDIVSDSTLSLEVRLKELSKIQGDATALAKVFGAENLVAGQVLLQNVDKVKKYTDAVSGTNVAQQQADLNTSTLSARLDQLSNAWDNMITSNSAATGVLSIFKGIVVFLTDNLTTIVGVIGAVVAVFVALKIAVLAGQAAIFAYNVAIGIGAVLSTEHAVSIGASNVAMKAQAIAGYAVAAAQWVMAGGIGAASAATWVFTAALLANPITWIVLAIIALIAALVALVVYFEDIVKWVKESDNVFAKLIRVALLPLILLFKFIGWQIDMVVMAFQALVNWVKTSDSGFASFIRGVIAEAITAFELLGAGLSLIGDAFSTVWGWITKFTSDALQPIFDLIDYLSDSTQKELGVNIAGAAGADGSEGINGLVDGVAGENGEDGVAAGSGAALINNKVAERDGIVDKLETNNKEEVTVTVKAPPGTADVSSTPGIEPRVGSTTGFE